MSTFKKAKVVMLSTNEPSKLGNLATYQGHSLAKVIKEGVKPKDSTLQFWNLYILSDDEIKEGDVVKIPCGVGKVKELTWKFGNDNPSYIVEDIFIYKLRYGQKEGELQINSFRYEDVKKIIATTDTSLEIFDKELSDMHSVKVNILLPQPSQQFIQKYIEEYNRGNIITDVLVEYNCGDSHCSLFGCQKHLGCKNESIQTVKINPKDNTITIKKVKDSYSREEVRKLCIDAFISGTVARNKIGTVKDSEIELKNMNIWLAENL